MGHSTGASFLKDYTKEESFLQGDFYNGHGRPTQNRHLIAFSKVLAFV
ncbi:hypothetical protein MTBBW1_620040 [Desulfamplus magnetovallimortis]|uniref:Uncharacterized protein n=1 Tax=Desulfamplus magnetovallimortis TaxID=1246637 RepID=A0A1W1HIF9_9BACT|nr:hypothetical protein MTBBW1_620040 [Desulfamplus magnetovallimortis]